MKTAIAILIVSLMSFSDIAHAAESKNKLSCDSLVEELRAYQKQRTSQDRVELEWMNQAVATAKDWHVRLARYEGTRLDIAPGAFDGMKKVTDKMEAEVDHMSQSKQETQDHLLDILTAMSGCLK